LLMAQAPGCSRLPDINFATQVIVTTDWQLNPSLEGGSEELDKSKAAINRDAVDIAKVASLLAKIQQRRAGYAGLRQRRTTECDAYCCELHDWGWLF